MLALQTCNTKVVLVYLQVVPDMLQVLQGLMQLRPDQPSGRTQLHAMLDRALVKLTRTLVGVQEAHPWCASGNIELERHNPCMKAGECNMPKKSACQAHA